MLFGSPHLNDDIQTYDVSTDIKSLEVDISAADFTIKQGEKFLVESNLKNLTVEDKNGALSVSDSETKKFGSLFSGAVLTLYVPPDTVFENASVKTGAGKLTVERLSSDTLILELGAGEASIESLIAASNAVISGGAGEFTVKDGELHNLDLDMGVGELRLTSALSGDCSFDLGVGESDITVIGDRENYKLDIEKGIGSITVDGMGVSDFKEQWGKENSIDISGGIGAVSLNFKD